MTKYRLRVKSAKDLEDKLLVLRGGLKKDDRLEVILSNFYDLPKIPRILIKLGFSLIRAHELPNGDVVMEIVFRFPPRKV
ncbi:MAG: hypothetical protein B6U85_10540 [Desulfurococcales archaeon ex4484_42]|nr:MAG: hypothetical protein B6U85_10540 [Desulfurococcales archaeon ex4484_42]